jgi:hypothetical protein
MMYGTVMSKLTPNVAQTNTGEFQPVIHGLIDRQQMYDMWAPYGERLVPDGSFDPATISPLETLHILFAGGKKIIEQATTLQQAGDDEFLDLLVDGFDGSMEPQQYAISGKFWESIHKSHMAQQKRAEDARAEYAEIWPKVVQKTARAALILPAEGIFTHNQAERFESWLMQPNGTPRVQYVPMSRLEYARFTHAFDHEVPFIPDSKNLCNDVAELALGVLISAHSLDPQGKVLRRHNRIHELVHASLSGLELYDVTRDDGRRIPQATIIGLYTQEPTTHCEQDEYSSVQNSELAEGLTEFITERLIEADPTLGDSLPRTRGYGPWANVIRMIEQYFPSLYQDIVETSLYDATTPEDKRNAIAAMHKHANRTIGKKNSLDRMFQTAGGTYGAAHNAK